MEMTREEFDKLHAQLDKLLMDELNARMEIEELERRISLDWESVRLPRINEINKDLWEVYIQIKLVRIKLVFAQLDPYELLGLEQSATIEQIASKLEELTAFFDEHIRRRQSQAEKYRKSTTPEGRRIFRDEISLLQYTETMRGRVIAAGMALRAKARMQIVEKKKRKWRFPFWK